MAPETLWQKVRRSFELDDGSFPSVAIVDLEVAEVANLYRIVRESSALVDSDVTFWDVEKSANVPLDSVPNAALLVAEGRAAGFAFAARGLEINSIELPNLGFQIFESVFSIHYQMGPAWQPLQVHAFFLWLRELVLMTKHGRLDLTVDGPIASEAFMYAWAQFAAEQ